MLLLNDESDAPHFVRCAEHGSFHRRIERQRLIRIGSPMINSLDEKTARAVSEQNLRRKSLLHNFHEPLKAISVPTLQKSGRLPAMLLRIACKRQFPGPTPYGMSRNRAFENVGSSDQGRRGTTAHYLDLFFWKIATRIRINAASLIK